MESDVVEEEVAENDLVVPPRTPPIRQPLLRSSSTYDHPDGPMLDS
jgi:hypothetical protein